MKVETIDSKMENRILLSMITDPIFLAKMTPKWDGKIGPLSTKYANLIGFWCVRHFNRYSDVPRSGIRYYYDKWSQKTHSEAESSMMEKYLGWLSQQSWDEVPDVNSEQMLHLAIEHINLIKLRKLNENLAADLVIGDINRSLERVSTFVKEEIGEDEVEDILNEDGITEIFETPESSLIAFEDGGMPNLDLIGLKRFFADQLAPSRLIAFQAPEKAGKTFLLVEMLAQGLLSRRNVAFFEVGDMSRKQIKMRIYTRIAQHPYMSPTLDWPCTIKIPIGLRRPPKGEFVAEVDHVERSFDRPLDKDIVINACQNFVEHRIGSRDPHFKLCVYPNFSCSVSMIEAKMFAWKLAGWIPEIVIIDYADLLAIPDKMDFRQAVNQIWGQLRRLSEEHDCLVLTATQADAESYRIETQDRRNFSEDKRKNAHVNGVIGINVTAKEKELGLMRLNWIGGREVPHSSRRCCYLATCLPIANPAVMSIF